MEEKKNNLLLIVNSLNHVNHMEEVLGEIELIWDRVLVSYMEDDSQHVSHHNL